MSSDSGERYKEKQRHRGSKTTEKERLPCPRCESNNTKFCYYNNYNLTQPRHFCKSCRRYWTQGGSLRNIPVGGVTRKNPKRSRSSSSSSSSSSQHHIQQPSTSVPLYGNINDSASFTSLLNTPQSPGLFALGGFGFGFGLGLGFEEMGIGLERGEYWPLMEAGDNNTWQLGSGDGGGCIGWSELAISTPANVTNSEL